MSIDICQLKLICRERIASGKPFASRFMPITMLDLIEQIEAQRERIKFYEPIINAALEICEDHERIDHIDEAVGNLPVEMWP